jgi:hypothetical protein
MTEDQRRDANDSTDARYETLKLEYEQICSSHQAITDFRGKLLGLLPLATGAGISYFWINPSRRRTRRKSLCFWPQRGYLGLL